MRRYLLYFSAAFAAGLTLTLCAALPEQILAHWHLFLFCLAGLACLCVRFRSPAAVVCLAGFCAALVYTTVYQTQLVDPITDLNGKSMTITATVRAFPDRYETNQRAELLVDSQASHMDLGRSSFPTIGYLPLTEEPLQPGDTVCVQVTFYVPTVRQGFDRAQYQMANGNYISFTYNKVSRNDRTPVACTVTHADKIPLRYQPLVWAQSWGSRIASRLPAREGGFLRALLLGDKQQLDAIDMLNLRKVGLSHVVAVSGMHLMFLVGLIYRLFSRRLGVPLSIAAILLFIPMAGSSPSVLRAGIMTLLAGLAYLCGREADSLTSLGAALLALLLWNPYAIFSLSLQLSFLSTFGILCFSEPLESFLFGWLYHRLPGRFLPKLARLFGASFACSCCAVVCTMPVLITSFGYLTVLSIPANLLTCFVVSLTFELGLILCLVPALGFVLTPVLTLCARYILSCADWLSQFHWGILYWEEPAGKLAVLTAALLVAVLILHRWTRPKFTAPVLCGILIAAVGYANYSHATSTLITLHAVGEGQMITIADGYDALNLIDCGSSANQDALETLRAYMHWHGFRRIDTVILTAVDVAHARAAGPLIEEIPVETVIIPDGLAESDTLTALRAAAKNEHLPLTTWTQTGEQPVALSGIEASIIGGVDRKLAVRLRGPSLDLLTVHSMTQKMLDELLAEAPLTAETVVMGNKFEKDDLFRTALSILKPSALYVLSDYETAGKLYGVPVKSTADFGDLTLRIPHT